MTNVAYESSDRKLKKSVFLRGNTEKYSNSEK